MPDTPLPPPPRLPTSTEPHPGPVTGPPEPESPELRAILAVHEEMKLLARTVDSLFYLMQEDRQERLGIMKRLEAIEERMPAPNGAHV